MEILSQQNKPEIYEQLIACLNQWCALNAKMDANGMLSLYHETAVLLGTFADKPCLTPYQIVGYFSTLYSGDKTHFNVTITEKLIYEQNNIVFTTGEYLFTWYQAGEKYSVPARFTFVFSKDIDNWKIFHHHSSILPSN